MQLLSLRIRLDTLLCNASEFIQALEKTRFLLEFQGNAHAAFRDTACFVQVQLLQDFVDEPQAGPITLDDLLVALIRGVI